PTRERASRVPRTVQDIVPAGELYRSRRLRRLPPTLTGVGGRTEFPVYRRRVFADDRLNAAASEIDRAGCVPGRRNVRARARGGGAARRSRVRRLAGR